MMMFKLLTGIVTVSLALFAGNERVEKNRLTKELCRTKAALVPLAMHISFVSHKQQVLEQQNQELVEHTQDMQEMFQQLQNKSVFDGVTAIYNSIYDRAASLFASKSTNSNDETVPSPAPFANLEVEELPPEFSSSPYEDPIILPHLSLSVSPPPPPPLHTESSLGRNAFSLGKSDYSLQQAFDIVMNALTDLLHKFVSASVVVKTTFCMDFHERTMSPLSVLASHNAIVDDDGVFVKQIDDVANVWISFGLLVLVLSRFWQSLCVGSFCAVQRRYTSTLCIQSAARRYLAVRKATGIRDTKAAIQLQCFLRCMAAMSKKKSLIMAKQRLAATKMQSIVRGHLARLQVKSTKHSVLIAQSLARGWHAIRLVQGCFKSIVCLQSAARRYLTVRKVAGIRDTMAAIQLQCFLRCMAAMSKKKSFIMAKQRLAATKMQRVVRGHLARLQVKSTKHSVLIAQSLARGWHAIRLVQGCFKSIVCLQSAARRYLAVKQVEVLKTQFQKRDPQREAVIADFIPVLPYFFERCKEIMGLDSTATCNDVEDWFRFCVERIESLAPIGAHINHLRYTVALKERIMCLFVEGENFDETKESSIVAVKHYMRTCPMEELESFMSDTLEYLLEIDGSERELRDLRCNEAFPEEIDAAVQESVGFQMDFMHLGHDATFKDVEKAYKRLAVKYHKDKQGKCPKLFHCLTDVTLALMTYLKEWDFEGDGSTTLGMVKSRLMDHYRRLAWYESTEKIVARLHNARAELKDKIDLP